MQTRPHYRRIIMYLNDVKIHKIGSISTLLRNVVNESDQTERRPSGGTMREGGESTQHS